VTSETGRSPARSTSDDVNKLGEHSCAVNQQWGTLITLWDNRP